MVTLWGRQWSRAELLARVGRLEQTYRLHGRYTGLPARLAGYGARWDGDEFVLWAEGEVVQAALFGEQLTLRRRIEADLGGISLRITDTVF